jgi:SulP family sulfate permease
MKQLTRFIPFTDLRGYNTSMLWSDLSAAAAITFLSIPQGVAYAIIAGLDPKMGLYAAIAPTIIGSLFRSSRHVVTGPTNAISLVVAGAVVVANQNGQDPTVVAVTLALLVGVMQFGAGAFRLGAIVDYISSPVVLGYITGAGVLIGVGQPPNITHTAQSVGNMFQSVAGWAQGMGEAHSLSVVVAFGSLALLLVIRQIAKALDKPIPAALITMTVALIASLALDLQSRGVVVVADIGAIPSGLPVITTPDLSIAISLLP